MEMNTLDTSYATGFSDKCAEMGVDPQALIKQSGVGDVVKSVGSGGGLGAAAGGAARKAIGNRGAAKPVTKTHPPTDSVARAKPMPRQPTTARNLMAGGGIGGAITPSYQWGTGERESAKNLSKMPSGTALRQLRRGYSQQAGSQPGGIQGL